MNQIATVPFPWSSILWNSNIPVPNDVEEFWKDQFGDVVPLTDEEKVRFLADFPNIADGNIFSTFKPAPLLSQDDFVASLIAQLPPAESNRPIINFSVPTVEVPISALCYFKKEYAKQKPVTPPVKGAKRGSDGEQRNDPHAEAWKVLTPWQRQCWTEMFVLKKKEMERLIEMKYAKKSLSRNQLMKQQRLQYYRQHQAQFKE